MLRPTWAEVDLQAIAHNVRVIQEYVGNGIKFMAVVKADGYGHGAVPVAKAALGAGAHWLGVATADEAMCLRDAGIKAPVLILGTGIPDTGEGELVAQDISLGVCTLEFANALNKAGARLGKRAKVHLKVDTGMGRLGVLPSQGVEFAEKLREMPYLELEGIYTHFAVADEKEKEYTLSQFQDFAQLVEELEARGMEIPLKHVCNSAALLDLPQTHLNMVRPGTLMYGFYPSPQVEHVLPLRPALTLKSRIVFLKEVPAGTPLSYGLTHTLSRETKIATLPIGYADGYRRHFSNRSEVLVRGRRVPQVGRVCMDQCLIDVGRVPGVSLGDEVVLLGRQGDEVVSATELAELIGTLAIDLTCGISKRVPRIYRECKKE